MDKDLISVLMCNYNYGQFIAHAIESVLTQTYKNFELIIVDDGSTDNSKEIIDSYDDPRIKKIFKKNNGQASAFNAGFEYSQGKYISLIDSDDWWCEKKLEKMIHSANLLDDDFGVIQHFIQVTDGISLEDYKKYRPSGDCYTLMKETDDINHFMPTSALFFLKSTLAKVLPMPQEITISADAYIMRAAVAFGNLFTLPINLGFYRRHNNYVFQNPNFDVKTKLNKIIDHLNKFYNENGFNLALKKFPTTPQICPNTNPDKYKTKLKNHDSLYGPFQELHKAHVDEAAIILDMYHKELLPSSSYPSMIDAGALHGGTFNGFLSLGWKVHAFEPHPLFFQKLEQKFESYVKKSQLSLNKCALSDSPREKASFYVSEESPGINSLTPFRESHEVLTQVPVTTLNNYFKDNRIENIDFLKIDTEGYDLMVLQGFPWEQLHPKVILCEFENRKTEQLGYKFEDMAEYLYQKGYQVFVSEWYPIVRYGGDTHAWRQLISYPSDLADENAWGNILAFSPPIQPQILIDEFKNNIRFKSTSPPAGQNPNKYELDKLLNFLEQAKQKGNKQEIIETLIVIVDKHPEHLSSAILLSNLFLESGDAEKAMTVIEYCSFYHPQSKALAKVREQIKNYCNTN